MASSTPSFLRRTLAVATLLTLSLSGRSMAGSPENAFGSPDLQALAAANKQAHTYRLTVARKALSPVLIEVSANNQSPSLTVKEIQSESKGPGSKRTYLVKTKVVKLSKAQLDRLLKELDEASFWTLPCADWKSPGAQVTSWKLEAVRDGKYHQITRCDPFRAVNKSCPQKKEMSQNCKRACDEGDFLCVLSCLWKLSGQSCQGLN